MLLMMLLMACGPKQAELEALQAENAALEARIVALEAQTQDVETRLATAEGQLETWDSLMKMATQSLESLSERPSRYSSSTGTGSSGSSTYTRPPPACEKLEDGRYRVLPTFDPQDFEGMSRTLRMIPHRGADGEIDGYRLSAIRRGSAGDSCGFKNGDIVHSLNGHKVRTMDQALEAYQALKDAPSAVVEVTRRGQPLSWEILPADKAD